MPGWIMKTVCGNIHHGTYMPLGGAKFHTGNLKIYNKECKCDCFNDGINKKKSVIGVIDIIVTILFINLFNRHKQIPFIL